MVYSLLDNDLYKFTMGQVIYHNFTDVDVEYELFVRRNMADLRPFKDEIEKEIMDLEQLILAPAEYDYLRSIRFLSKDFIDWFRGFKFRPREHVRVIEGEKNLEIIIKGNWLETIFYEVPILAIISEAYHSRDGNSGLIACNKNLDKKIEKIKNIGSALKIAEFGTRRRFSYMIHDHVIDQLVQRVPDNIVGTSNVFLAMKYGIKPIGTIAHEIIQCAQQLFPLKNHQKDIMNLWSNEFKGDLGIMLTDTLNINAFCNDFNLKFAKLFDGIRQDSGDPFEIGEIIIEHYEKLGVDPKTKTIVFSDSLDIEKAEALFNHFKDRIKVSFGIGTNLTNDCGDKPLSIVIKVQSCNGLPVAKISDTPEKAVCRDENYLNYLKSVFL